MYPRQGSEGPELHKGTDSEARRSQRMGGLEPRVMGLHRDALKGFSLGGKGRETRQDPRVLLTQITSETMRCVLCTGVRGTGRQ